MATDPKPRRLRFTLRTLLVVMAAVGVWLGWQLSIVRERQATRHWLSEGAGWFITATDYAQIPSPPAAEPTARQVPFWRLWLGDEPIAQIGFEPVVGKAERQHVKKLFPEAYVSDQ
jgi:hypothetical protein